MRRPRELELPDVGVLELVDPETGRRREVQTGDARLRARYARPPPPPQRLAPSRSAAGADHLVLRTDRDWLVDVVAFVATRRDRAAALARERGRDLAFLARRPAAGSCWRWSPWPSPT